MIIESLAPTRVDLAGGTLDIWPLYLFHNNSQTINFAINCYARCRLIPRRGRTIELVSLDLKVRETFPSLAALKLALAKAKKLRLPLLARLVLAFEPQEGVTLETTSGSPAGAGLGGSSALNIAVCGALSRFTGRKLPRRKLIELARNIEAQVLGVPAGEQDYYSAMYGGVQAIRLQPQGVRPRRLPVDNRALSERVVLCYTGQSRNSGINNWEVMKAHIDGDRSVVRQFDRIAAIATEMRQALEQADWNGVARLIRLDWEARKKNYPGITTRLIDGLISLARRHGSLAAKACGAGGGGCVLFLVKPEAKPRIERALEAEGARVIPVKVVSHGLQVSSAREN
jgi:D-glycero-alpha-D-manno-heptose-7-phosphate kinase